jgi:hypothetical protein
MKSAMQAPMAGSGAPVGGARQGTRGRGWSIGRDVVTPGTAALFLVSTVTGVMLLLHGRAGWSMPRTSG